MNRITALILILSFISNLLIAQDFRVLVFSKTSGFRHNSIEAGHTAIQNLGTQHSFSVTISENSEDFTIENLRNYECIVFLSTTGDILNSEEQTAFESYIGSGGGFVGIHAASDTEYGWEWYGGLVGAYFDSHPSIQEATIEVPDRVHPSTSFLGDYWVRTDEWYNYRDNPRGEVHVLATLDEETYEGGNMGHDHPITWCHEYEGGRSWYTGGGHTIESYSEPDFLNHILGGILFSAGQVEGDFSATVSEKFEMRILDNNPKSPMAIAVLPNLDVLYIERAGKLKLWKQATGIISEVGELDVDSGREDGLIGITIDPDYENNNWIYLFYSPADKEQQNVSRFRFIDEQLDLTSEQIILEIPVQRDQCCHSGGDLEFDHNGYLWIATGDNVNPFQSNGYAPIDEREGREPFDAQATSANTNDLRGKVLRIAPEDDGSYTIPDGNLFSNGEGGLPEIYVMGVRNAFRIAVNQGSELVWGDVGPDASGNSSIRGPRGYDEINRTSVPGNFGWPYAVADNKAYNDYNFETEVAGELFDLTNLTNNSPNNTGSLNLPSAIPAWLFYHNGNNPDRPEFNASGGRSVLGGDFYEFKSENEEQMGLPEYFDGVLLAGDWSRNWIKEIRVDDDGNLLQINPFIPHIELNSPIDIEIGPDGNVYIAEWGTGFSNDNADARIIRVSYASTSANRAPSAFIMTDNQSGLAPLTIKFDGSDSQDPDIGDQITYSWDFDDDGMEDSKDIMPTFTFNHDGIYNSTLMVKDQEGEQSIAQVQIIVGNTEPYLTIVYPEDGGFYEVGDTIRYQINTSDAEDGDECAQNLPLGIRVEPSIGHDDHSHGEGADDGCEGEFITAPHGDGFDDVFYVLNAEYTDRGGQVEFPLTKKLFNVLQPKTKQAQYAQELFDLRTEETGDFLGGDLNMAYINHNSYLGYSPMNFKNIKYMTVRWAALNHPSTIEVHIDSPDGPIIAQRSLPVTGAWQVYDYFTMVLDDPGGTHDMYLVFKNAGKTGLGNINFMEFHGQGISSSDHQEGMGLTATYYSNSDFTGTSVSRIEPMIAWDWDNESPVEGIDGDNFSVRWEGQITAKSSGIKELSRQLKNGSVKVWIDGSQIINESNATGEFNFEKDILYDFVCEYVHLAGDAEVAIRWEGSNPVNVIHTENFRIKSETTSIHPFSDSNVDNVFPNPFQNYILVDDSFINKPFKIINSAGQMVKEGIAAGQRIETAQLSEGFYYLLINGKKIKIVKAGE